ncbi:hypothetical protein, variant [Verruconis gallopava]|uniref:1-alkyl-2-acetylglycerophosphocholine esterase n=1 Tax=Verruconis gallopava TaxID=253628 RepID=A0A0D1XI12_9PEZI|nr:uncharacterized protein PV09_06744 [Verruconis gallopava]XP_016211771.1 hypothetical protein, variant [Verruconis gallopava]KIW01901.1 hypothetical protein PV09_06744 [Verruconis gallopava]KIW01902.1 hypothetical protein, variant [Verruconis gallopava]
MAGQTTVVVISALILLGSGLFSWWKTSTIDFLFLLDTCLSSLPASDIKSNLLASIKDFTMAVSSAGQLFGSIATVILVHIQLALAQNVSTGFSLGARALAPLDPPVKTADPLGTYGVGVRRETYDFEDRQLNVSWWYPANTASGCKIYLESGGIYGTACSEAPLDTSGGPYPLILFSPGLAAHDDTYFFYCQNLASYGYIVVSINHLDATKAAVAANPIAYISAIVQALLNNSSWTVWLIYSNWFRSTHFALTYRPQEQQFILDQAIAAASNSSSFFNGMIDTNNIGMSGHSLGGFYTLIKGGGLAIYCDKPLSASESNTQNILVTEISICAWPEAKNLTSPQALHDPRIKAIISLAPPLFFQSEDEISRAAAAIKTPMMIITGNDPKLESTLAPQEQVYDSATTPKYIVEIDNTDHLLVSEAYQFNKGPGSLISAEDKANFTEKATVYEVYSSAFFDVYLKNMTERKGVMHSKSSEFVAKLEYND